MLTHVCDSARVSARNRCCCSHRFAVSVCSCSSVRAKQMLLQELLRESNPSMFQKAEEDELRKRKEKELAEEAKKKQVRGRARLRGV